MDKTTMDEEKPERRPPCGVPHVLPVRPIKGPNWRAYNPHVGARRKDRVTPKHDPDWAKDLPKVAPMGCEIVDLQGCCERFGMTTYRKRLLSRAAARQYVIIDGKPWPLLKDGYHINLMGHHPGTLRAQEAMRSGAYAEISKVAQKKAGRSPRQLFNAALKEYAQKNKLDLFQMFVKLSYRNPSVLISAMNKLLPNKVQVSVGPEDLLALIRRISEVISIHIKDETVLAAIVQDLEGLEIQHEDEIIEGLGSAGEPSD